MDKRITAYTFDASLRRITFTNQPTIEYERLGIITHVPTGAIIFDPVNMQARVSGNTIDLMYDTSSMADGDALRIFYNTDPEPSTGSMVVSGTVSVDNFPQDNNYFP